jgi:signal transduction histidine kinase
VLLITAALLESLPPFSWRITETIEEASTSKPRPPKPPAPPQVPREPVIKIEKPAPGAKTEGLDISIDERGIRVTPRAASAPAAGAPTYPASSPSSASSASAPAGRVATLENSGSVVKETVKVVVDDALKGVQDGWKAGAASSPGGPGTQIEVVTVDHKGREDGSGSTTIRLSLPPGSDAEAVRDALKEAASDLKEAARAAREEAKAAEQEAAAASVEISDGPLERVRHVKLGDFLTDLAALWILASIIIKITYKGQLQARAEAALATETAEAEQLKRQVVEARMAAMQAQVEPHFLFNTLASIDHLIETDPPRASRMQKSLIALLRATMPAMREGTVNGVRSLGQEIAVIEPYLEILKVRMEERLETQVDVPEGLRSAEFPPMMVQGLVENAIKHGLEPKPEGGTLAVQAEVAHGKLVVTVTDTGVGFGQANTAGTGTGLDNIRERLRLLYGHEARLDIRSPTHGGTQTIITLPYKAHAAPAAPSGMEPPVDAQTSGASA